MHQVIILKCMSVISSKFYMLYSSVKHGLFNISDQSINSFLHLYSSIPTSIVYRLFFPQSIHTLVYPHITPFLLTPLLLPSLPPSV